MTHIKRYPFTSFPNGWFAVAVSSDLKPGQVTPLRAFGQELVLYRTTSGQALLTEAYCPHQGAHLGHGGKVEGEKLRCPFHGWCFDGKSGACVEVPFATKIPPRGKLRTWAVAEIDGMVFAHYHHAGEAPSWEVPSEDDGNWSAPDILQWELKTCCQEVLENSVDTSHLPTVHQSMRPGRYIPGTMEGPVAKHKLVVNWDGEYIGAPGQEMTAELSVRCYGLGMIYVDVHVAMMGMTGRQRIYVTPIDEDHILLRGVLQVKKLPDEDVTRTVAGMWRNGFETDFPKDFPIWENKVYKEQPALSEADGPVMPFRRWAKQFYGDLLARQAMASDAA